MFELAKKANVLPHDVAKALGLNRITVSLWYNGHSKPHRLLTDKVSSLLDAISKAVDAGELPISVDVDRRERRNEVHKVLMKYMDSAETDVNQISPVS
jgi:molybdenum cofactor biosynthesis enzyme MoaA